ncbi:hypothetical protein HY404_03095 [Candidatus Microgenomates bacterium]|nr:hypothetical protein [Candidatus Microgenomates bacterium]
MSDKKRLVLIDGNAILHRAYHALPPLTSRSGQLVNAVYGFCAMLFKVVNDLQPDFLAVTFDTPKPTFRHAAYVGYQAHRPRMESDLSDQIELVHEVVRAADIPIYEEPGYEADDVIGTLAMQAVSENQATQKTQKTQKTRKPESQKARISDIQNLRSSESSEFSGPLEVIIVSGDRDLLQLVNDRVKVYMPIKGVTEAKLFGTAEVEERMGVKPSQIVDLKALMGDASDNYPGIPGIGPKTAAILIGKFGTLENIFSQLDKIDDKTVAKLAAGHESGVLSKKLARIEINAPVTLDLEKVRLTPLVGNKNLIEKLAEFGFKSLTARARGIVKKEDDQSRLNRDQLKLI